jgi:sugar phosphate isomerase/epimerase
MEFLRRAIDAARILETDTLRIFSYWQVENPGQERSRILDGLRQVTAVAEKEKIRLAIENEPGCNLADCAQTAAALAEVRSPRLGMAWDVVNGATAGETPYPDGFRRLDLKRVWHLHIKDSRYNPAAGRREICAVGDGDTPYAGIFRALADAGYRGALSMETHFSIGGSREAASRRSMEGLIRAVEHASGAS